MGRLPCILTVKDKPASCTCVQHHSSGRIVRGEEGAHSYWRVFRGKEVGHSSGRVSGGEEGAHKRCFLDQPCPLCKQADQWSVFNAEQEKSTAMSACLYRSVPAPLRDDRMHFLHRLFRLCMMALECACCVACRRICGIAHKPGWSIAVGRNTALHVWPGALRAGSPRASVCSQTRPYVAVSCLRAVVQLVIQSRRLLCHLQTLAVCQSAGQHFRAWLHGAATLLQREFGQ